MNLHETKIKKAEVTLITFTNWNNKTENRIRIDVPGTEPIFVKIGETNYQKLLNLNNEQTTAQGGAKTQK